MELIKLVKIFKFSPTILLDQFGLCSPCSIGLLIHQLLKSAGRSSFVSFLAPFSTQICTLDKFLNKKTYHEQHDVLRRCAFCED